MIKQIGSEYKLYSKSGDKVLGSFKSLEAALKREKQIRFFKYLDSKKK